MKRVFLFVAVNLAVMFLLMLAVNVILSLAGPDVRESMYHGGIDMFSLGVFSLVFGMGGAFISLLISKPMAKWSVGAQVIDGSEGERERWLVATVERLARSANIKMPEVAIYRGAPNAFATGAFKNSALVAVSDQIMARMNRSASSLSPSSNRIRSVILRGLPPTVPMATMLFFSIPSKQ